MGPVDRVLIEYLLHDLGHVLSGLGLLQEQEDADLGADLDP